jgi:hypothetical protein
MAMTDPQAVLRTSRVMYALFCSIFGLVFLFATFVAIAKEPAFWLPTVIMGGVLAASVSWMATTSLTLADNYIHYRSLFIVKDVLISELKEANFIVGASSFKPYQRLVLSVRGTDGTKEVTINLGLFDRAEIRAWMTALNARLSQ